MTASLLRKLEPWSIAAAWLPVTVPAAVLVGENIILLFYDVCFVSSSSMLVSTTGETGKLRKSCGPMR